MRVLFFSDSHGQHRRLGALPCGDLLVVGGDVTLRGTVKEADDFIEWLGALDFRHKVFVAGNHDYCFEGLTQTEVQAILPPGVHYLCDSGVELEGVRIYGSPVTPTFHNMAFNRGAEIAEHWAQIPDGLDILITHGPAFGILDRTVRGEQVGCPVLGRAIEEKRPRYHLFGHIHEEYGILEQNFTIFINGSMVDARYRPAHSPTLLEISGPPNTNNYEPTTTDCSFGRRSRATCKQTGGVEPSLCGLSQRVDR